MEAYPETFAIVDTETTGMRPGLARVMDIGIIRVERGDVVERYQTLIHPGMIVPPYISGFTGIRDVDLEDAPSFDEVALTVERLLKGSVFVAHNAAFDYGFIKAEFACVGMEWTAETLCTVQLSRALFPRERSHSLDAVIERHGIDISDRHRALPDAEAVLQFMKKAVDMTEPKILARAVASVRRAPAGTAVRGSLTYVYDNADDVIRE